MPIDKHLNINNLSFHLVQRSCIGFADGGWQFIVIIYQLLLSSNQCHVFSNELQSDFQIGPAKQVVV